ncbi:archease [bacterium]|nr:archease [candidate division CSSED10-310 bacterium]
MKAGPYGSFVELESVADIGMEIQSNDLNTLFATAGWVLFHYMTDIRLARSEIRASFEIGSSDLEELMVDWLNELIYVHETRNLLLVEFCVSVSFDSLSGSAGGEPFDPDRHVRKNLIKAATYHQLSVRKHRNGWFARVILDV